MRDVSKTLQVCNMDNKVERVVSQSAVIAYLAKNLDQLVAVDDFLPINI